MRESPFSDRALQLEIPYMTSDALTGNMIGEIISDYKLDMYSVTINI